MDRDRYSSDRAMFIYDSVALKAPWRNVTINILFIIMSNIKYEKGIKKVSKSLKHHFFQVQTTRATDSRKKRQWGTGSQAKKHSQLQRN